MDAFELWCWRRLLSPLDCKEIQPVHSKGDQSWVFLEGLMLKLKLQYFSHLMWRVDSLEKALMLRGIGGRRRRGQQDEMFRWHHQLDGHGFGWTLGVGDGQGGLTCCASWGHKESFITEWLNWTELKRSLPFSLDFPGGSSGKEPTCQFRRHKRSRFHPWVGKIP